MTTFHDSAMLTLCDIIRHNMLTSVPTPICFCKLFSCKACPGINCSSENRFSTFLVRSGYRNQDVLIWARRFASVLYHVAPPRTRIASPSLASSRPTSQQLVPTAQYRPALPDRAVPPRPDRKILDASQDFRRSKIRVLLFSRTKIGYQRKVIRTTSKIKKKYLFVLRTRRSKI